MALRVLLVIVALGLLAVTYAPIRSGTAASDKTSACGAVGLMPGELERERTRQLTLCLLNEERAERGLGALRRESRLELASQRHSEDMVKRRFFEHDDPAGVEPHERMLSASYPANNAITGENIAWATGTEASPAEIVDSWMHSPGHKENILRPEFTEVGVGLASGAPERQTSTNPAFTYTTDFGGPPVR